MCLTSVVKFSDIVGIFVIGDLLLGRLAMDRLDVRILDALQREGSLTQSELAEHVGSSPSTCLRRVQRLRNSGHLERCVYLADPRKLERGLRAIITVVTRLPKSRSPMTKTSIISENLTAYRTCPGKPAMKRWAAFLRTSGYMQ